VVRSWGAATRLNDQPFFDAPLKIGDRLGVGPLELEVVANADSEPIDVESWLCLPANDDFDSDQHITDQKQRLDEEVASLELLKKSLEAERAQLSGETATHAQRMAEQLAAVTAAREGFERQCDLWQTERDQIQARITDDLDRCQRQLADVDRMRQEFDRERTAWDERRRAIEVELTARSEVVDRQARELEAHAHRLAAQPAASVSNRQANEDEALSEEEVFARLRGHASLRPGSVENPPEQAPQSVPAITTPAVHDAADDEESIDDYMARLLNRMRGDSGPNATEAATRPKPRMPKAVMPPAVVTPAPAKSSANRQQAETPVPRPAPVPAQLVARSSAPESAVNLKAMRDLANMTTRGAIDKHAHGRWSRAAVGKGVGGFVSFVCGVWLMFSHLSALGILSSFVGFAGVVAGIFWIVQAALLVRNLRLAGRRTNKSLDADMPASDLGGAIPADEPNAALQETAADSSTEHSAWTQRRRIAHRAFQNGARRVASTVRRIVEYARRG